MNRITKTLTLVVALFALISCSKDYISPDELFKDGSKVAKTTIHTRSGEFEDTVTPFASTAVYRKSDLEGKSWFVANSGGKMVYDTFMFSLYFDSIDHLKVGDVLNPDRFVFSFFYSSDSNATTHTYGGKITLAGKGDDYVILRFHKVSFSCSFGEYVTDGYLYCPLLDKYEDNGLVPNFLKTGLQ